MIDIKIGFRVVGHAKVPLIIDLERYCHWLICGASGSGKSYLLKYIFASLLRFCNKDMKVLEIFCLDFKNSGDYSFMDADHLSTGKNCLDMFNLIYEKYVYIKDNNLPDKVLVVFDEWAAFTLWLNGFDKKIAKDVMDKSAEMLMMGRSLGSNHGGVYQFTVLQRPDASYFSNARENYMIKIIMRDVTRSIRTMLEIEKEDIPKEHIIKPGHGICVIDDSINAFVVPTYDVDAMTEMLRAKQREA